VDVIAGDAVRIRCGEITLEGLLHLPEGAGPFPGVVICHPHPQMGGDMYNNVVGALVRAALESGYAALRFNFRGVGESEGGYAGGLGEQDDVRAALAWLREQPAIDGDRMVLAGYSFGAMVALRVASGRRDLAGVIAVSNPTQRGPMAEVHLQAPALFATGDRDQYCDSELLKEHREQLGDDVTVEVLPGVDHFWWGSDDRLTETVAAFLARLPHVAPPRQA
jgi:alpha/beta superfamily hydrolase